MGTSTIGVVERTYETEGLENCTFIKAVQVGLLNGTTSDLVLDRLLVEGTFVDTEGVQQ